jgi:hypothetical protein
MKLTFNESGGITTRKSLSQLRQVHTSLLFIFLKLHLILLSSLLKFVKVTYLFLKFVSIKIWYVIIPMRTTYRAYIVLGKYSHILYPSD